MIARFMFFYKPGVTKELAENVSNESSDAKTNGIKLKEGVYIATTSAAAELCDNHDAPCYTLLCRYESFPNAPMSCTMHPAVTNHLQEIDNGMESRMTPIQKGEDDEDIATSDAYTLKSDSSTTWTSFPSRISETVCTKNNATSTYGFRLRRTLYGWKDNFINFPTDMVPLSYKLCRRCGH